LVGQDVAEVAALADRPRVRDVVLAVASGELASARAELTLAAPAAGMIELRLRGVPGGAVANLSDVTESVQLRERLARLARFDQMTGLANRSLLKEELGFWLDTGRRVGVLYLDLDGFKAVNDRFGHLAGDAVLVEAARRLVGAASGVPQRSVVARMGGDEFVVALQDCGVYEAAQASEAVLAALHPTFDVDDRAVRIGASIGVAATDDGGSTRTGAAGADDLLHRADIAMFAAKEAGRSQVRQWEAVVEERAMRKVDIAIGLRRALDTGQLALAYQPIVRLSDGVIVGAEALIRLHPDNPVTPPGLRGLPGTSGPQGRVPDDVEAHSMARRWHTPRAFDGSLEGLADLVSPAELVEVAEGTGEIDELGRWVLSEATRQAALWRSLDLDVRVSVNMSVRQLSDPDFVTAVRSALAAARLPADRLVIEITEGQLLGEGDRANDTIRRLRSDGVQLAIDDFGSGYSSLSYLRRMPIRTVKIDRTLLEGVGSDPRATTLVRAVIGAARGLGLLVVCEGIEHLSTARFLRDLGAWAGQGFALHAAMSSTALIDVLQGPPVSLADADRPPRTLHAVPAPPPGSIPAAGAARNGDHGTPISHHETAVSRD
jgi:diguanylate cyclase (GGDEF)-like protein